MLLYILEKNIAKQREVNGWAGSRCWCLASLEWPFGKWRWDCWVVSRPPRAQKRTSWTARAPTSSQDGSSPTLTPTIHLCPEPGLHDKVFQSPPNTMEHLDTPSKVELTQKPTEGCSGLQHVQNHQSQDKRKDFVFRWHQISLSGSWRSFPYSWPGKRNMPLTYDPGKREGNFTDSMNKINSPWQATERGKRWSGSCSPLLVKTFWTLLPPHCRRLLMQRVIFACNLSLGSN